MDQTQVRTVINTSSPNMRAARSMRLTRGVLINRSGAGAGSTTERGDLVICHINQPSTIAFGTVDNSYMVTFTDK